MIMSTSSSEPIRIQPPDMAAPGGHYSHGSVSGGLVFVSGQLPIMADGTRLNDAPFSVQVAQTLANVDAILMASGSSISQLVSVRVYITDIEQWPEFNELYAVWAGPTRASRAVVPVPELHFGFLIEIEAVAAVTPP